MCRCPGAQVDLIEQKAIYFDGDKGEVTRVEEIPDDLKEAALERRDMLIEAVADVDEEIAELFLMEEIPDVQTLKVGALAMQATQGVGHARVWDTARGCWHPAASCLPWR